MQNQEIVNILQDAQKSKRLAQVTLKDKTAVNVDDALNCINVVRRANIILSNV